MLTGDLTACSSELENSYGIGLAAGSEDAKVRACVPECITYASFLPSACIVCLTRAPVLVPYQTLLAGSPTFAADAVEIWAVGSLSGGFGGGDDGGTDYGDDGVDDYDYDD